MLTPHVLMASGPGGGPYGGMPGAPYGGGIPGAPPPGYGPPPGGGPPPMGLPPMGPRTDALAIVSLIAGVLGLAVGMVNIFFMVFGACCALCTVGATFIGVFALIPSVIGAVCGGLSLKRVKERPEELQGKGLAIAGTTVSGIAVVVALTTIVLPWLGIGCLAANSAVNGPHRPAPTWEPAPAPDPWNAPAPDPSAVDPNAVPVDPNAVPTDPGVAPVDPSAPPPTGGAP